MNVDSIVFLISDFTHMPAAYKTEILSAKSISLYIDEYPELCKIYIHEACKIESTQLRIDPQKPFVANQNITSSSNGLVAATYNGLSVYPDGSRWSIKDFFELLSLVKFDAAIYLFALFYQEHNSNYKFYLDVKKYLSNLDAINETPFIKHFYNLCRLFAINEVNNIQHADIIELFNKEINNTNDIIA
ncbi:hypothetical protein [Psychrobacter sp. AOP31-A1-22]|uniref:hypothetical protein n=1 Tax=Psychrobacter sp. AOP31-A1-22 TaxID=3457696 RepID=UPI00403690CB